MSEQESKPDSGVKPTQKFSIFTGIQYGTTAAATLLFIRACTNRFLTHRQRGSNVIGSIGCLYLSVANEFGIFPFNFFVKEKISTREE